MISIMCEGPYLAAVLNRASEILGHTTVTVRIDDDNDVRLYELMFVVSAGATDDILEELCDALWDSGTNYGLPGISGSRDGEE
jgi:hypothetical protein